MSVVHIQNRVEDGQVWLSASDVVAALRDRAARWDRMALAPGDDSPEEQHKTACWAASAALERSADEIDLACIARVNA